MVTDIDKRLFLSRMKKACEIARQKGAVFNEAVVTAQGALESNWGKSYLAQKANNLFGIKAGKDWKGETIELPTKEYVNGKWIEVIARWRKYPSWNLCIVDYANLIKTRKWFQDALKYLDDPEKFLRSILPAPGKPGWATDPEYFSKVKQIALQIEALGGPKWIREESPGSSSKSL